jgi:hypothetical protein
MSKRGNQKVRTIALIQAEKHEKYGFTSLETLSSWNEQIDKNKDSDFVCKKEFQCMGVTDDAEDD